MFGFLVVEEVEDRAVTIIPVVPVMIVEAILAAKEFNKTIKYAPFRRPTHFVRGLL